MDFCWKCTYSCFECWKGLCYKIMTFLSAPCLGAYWGCAFAGIAWHHVWALTPFLRCCTIECGFCQRFLSICLNCCCEPIFKLCGDCVGRIKSGQQLDCYNERWKSGRAKRMCWKLKLRTILQLDNTQRTLYLIQNNSHFSVILNLVFTSNFIYLSLKLFV